MSMEPPPPPPKKKKKKKTKKNTNFFYLMVLSRYLLYPAISVNAWLEFFSVHDILIYLLRDA